MMRRRALLAGAGAIAALQTAGAESRLSLVVGAPPGARSDQFARAFAPFLERHLPGTQVEIRNLPAEAGLAAYRAVAAAPPDGSVIGWAVTPSLPARLADHAEPALLGRLRLLGSVQREPIAFVSSAAHPLDAAEALIGATATARQAMPLACPPAGSPPHLVALLLQGLAGVPLNLVAFPSAAAARQAVLAGNAAAACLGLSDTVIDLRHGRLVGVAATRFGPTEALSRLPLAHDANLPRLTSIRRGLAAPTALPAPLIDRFEATLQRIAADAEFAAQAESDGFADEWLAGANWTTVAYEERDRLAGLWRAVPWLPVEAG